VVAGQPKHRLRQLHHNLSQAGKLISSPAEQRAGALQNLTREPLDVLIIGGGIVGAGIARDAAMRGLRTGLVEQRDFASGTSGRSSRLLHGGMRYLAQGRIGLVRQASLEKSILHYIAPHLAQPLAFIFPAYPGTDWPLWQMRIGVKLYDLLCSGRNLGKSSGMSREETLHSIPQLNPKDLAGAVRYFDAFTNDARLVLDTLRSAAAHGAALLNYCQFQDASRQDNGWRCTVADKLTNAVHEVRARVVVNASGPWAARLPHSHVKLRLTKGIHLVMERSRVPATDAVVLTEGRRILFVIPWGQRIILGTTDTDYSGPPDDVRPDAADINYLLGVANDFFPQAALSTKDIISSWAGLRPLLADGKGAASDISRAHQIRNPEPNWWDVAGGKLTTCRLMAEQTVDRLVAAAGLSAQKCRTASEPLLEKPDNFSGILPPEFRREVIEHYCASEWALHLDDVMIRRTSWHYYHADTNEKARQAADWMAEMLGWSEAERDGELGRYRAAAPFQI
jgi:glycerol-3-phosphate dehydrogenase